MNPGQPTLSGGAPSQTRSWWLIGVAAFAFLWIVARACVQSITIDEADGYSFYAGRVDPTHWEASSVNHLLNSLIMRLFIAVFGLSPVTVRMPALIGAAIYIGAAYYLVRLISDEIELQLPLFLCLVYNPFVMEHLVVGRGYSLAVACLIAAIALAAGSLSPGTRSPANPYRTSSICSLLIALSFCGSFSFALVDATALAMIFLWVWRSGPGQDGKRGGLVWTAKLLAACVLPGLLLTAFLAGDIMRDRRQISLAWGAKSLKETFGSVISASYYEPNPYLLSPSIYKFVTNWHEWLFPLLGVACLWQVISVLRNRKALKDSGSKWQAAFTLWAAGILAVSLGMYRLLYRLFHILMPLGRRAVFIAPLFMLAVGGLIAIRVPTRAGFWARRTALVMLWLTAAYFLGCMRLSYFMEWKYNSDAKDIYAVLAAYNHKYGVKEISANWRYVSVINFYRVLSGRESIEEILGAPNEVATYPLGKPIYVVHYTTDLPFIDSQQLKVVYHNETTDAAIAIRPEVESAPAR